MHAAVLQPALDFAPLASVGAAVFVLLAAGVTAMTAIVFVFWFVAMLVKGVLMLFVKLPTSLLSEPGPPAPPPAEPSLFVCPDPVCRSVNPREASFCRQCGRMFKRPDRP